MAMSTTTNTNTILLRPRRYAQYAGSFLLVALLPPPKQLPSLPCEVWTAIFSCANSKDLWALMRVCATFKELAHPLVYSRVQLSQLVSLDKFVARLELADQHWSPIHRIPYSCPGRWVQTLDLSAVALDSDGQTQAQAQALILDSLLVRLFPLVPFLARFSMNPAVVLSRRAMESLGNIASPGGLRALEGISYVPELSNNDKDEEPLTRLLRCCTHLEEVEIIGRGPDPTELLHAQLPQLQLSESFVPLHLPHLRTLTILSVYSSSLLLALLHSPLPALEKLTITPYDDVPDALSTAFIQTHGAALRSLLLFTPKSWPTRLHPSPPSSVLLRAAPTLRHLSLERPLPSASQVQLVCDDYNTHPLQILSVPRPDADFWRVLERTLLPKLPALRAVRARDVRWLRKGMGASAQATGVQGEMMEWRRRLLRRGVRMLDGEWREYEA
ncbi:hypothetical protein C8F01DRAFT_1106766 [Mycena amicta]|nr:hypothetical protein C8F01DRAFT_1106766 [Mycena amicta]